MDFENINFRVSNKNSLSDSEKEFLLESYRELFGQIYGIDIYDSLIKLTNKNKKIYNKLKFFSENYYRSQEMLEELPEHDDLSLLLIFLEDNLIGAARIKIFDDFTALIPDVAIGIGSLEEKREIWKLAIKYIENYLLNKNYQKMYVEIPLQNPWLLIYANELGFEEDPEDIVISEETRTYLLNKKLERTKNEKPNNRNR